MTVSGRNIRTLVLLVSLGVNLFLLGAVITHMLTRQSPPVVPEMSWMVRDLGAADRQAIRPRLQELGDSLRPLRVEMFQAQQEVNRQLQQEPLDEEAALAAFARLREANLRYQQQSHQQMVSLMASVEPEQRRRIMRFMSDRRPPEPPRGERPARDPASSPLPR